MELLGIEPRIPACKAGVFPLALQPLTKDGYRHLVPASLVDDRLDAMPV